MPQHSPIFVLYNDRPISKTKKFFRLFDKRRKNQINILPPADYTAKKLPHMSFFPCGSLIQLLFILGAIKWDDQSSYLRPAMSLRIAAKSYLVRSRFLSYTFSVTILILIAVSLTESSSSSASKSTSLISSRSSR